MSLTEHQQNVLAAFAPVNTDVDIVLLYTRIYGDPGVMPVRQMQRRLAASFLRVNQALTASAGSKAGRIEVGDTKRTYRYNTQG